VVRLCDCDTMLDARSGGGELHMEDCRFGKVNFYVSPPPRNFASAGDCLEQVYIETGVSTWKLILNYISYRF
jgi:hypothetical protein